MAMQASLLFYQLISSLRGTTALLACIAFGFQNDERRCLRVVLTYDPNVFIHIKPKLIEEGRNKVIAEKINVATQQLKDLFRMNRSLLHTKSRSNCAFLTGIMGVSSNFGWFGWTECD